MVHQNEYIPVIHPAPHSSPLEVVGVVGVDPESEGRQQLGCQPIMCKYSSQVTNMEGKSREVFFSSFSQEQTLHMYLKILSA